EQRRHGDVGADGGHAGAGTGQGRLRHARDHAGRYRIVGHIDGNLEDRLFAAAEPLRPTQCNVEDFLSFDHLGECLAADRRLHDVFHIVDADTPVTALLSVDGEFQIRLAHDPEDPYIFEALDIGERVLDLIGQAFELLEVWANDLHRVVSLDPGEALHDVIADVLREVPIHADNGSLELLVHFLHQFRL